MNAAQGVLRPERCPLRNHSNTSTSVSRVGRERKTTARISEFDCPRTTLGTSWFVMEGLNRQDPRVPAAQIL